jgi:hypothetical protein
VLPTAKRWAVTACAIAAASLPSLLAYNPAPSPTFLNQALALVGWGLFVVFAGWSWAAARSVGALLAALGLVAAAALWSWGPGALPASLALLDIGLAAAAALPGPDDTPVVFVPIDPY